MPHSTHEELDPRDRSTSRSRTLKFSNDMRTSLEKFPDHVDSFLAQSEEYMNGSDNLNGHTHQTSPAPERWQPRKDAATGLSSWMSGTYGTQRGHARQKSLSDAIKTIRTRRGSVSANAHEIADALKAPVSPKLIILCIIWYMSSALTNTSSKSILNAFPKPATLTLIQFAFVASFCIISSWLASIYPNLKNAIPALKHGIRPPTRDVMITTLPLAAFQIGGHLLSSTATAKIPVSLVHTIKGLSPLFTVLAYRFIFDIRYPVATYLSLIPLTLGVMLACSAEFKGNISGIIFAFLAAIIFVTQNIFSKRLFNEAAKAEADGQYAHSRKLDKLNLLCYSSGLAFLITAPIWFWTEGISLITDFFHDGSLDLVDQPEAFDHGRLALEFVFNGTFHFGQNIIAFVLLSLVSPVTYSVASLIKRVFVVVIAIIWFQNKTTPLQAVGIGLTFLGLYLYDRTADNNKADRKAKLMDIKDETLLPLNTTRSSLSVETNAPVFDSPLPISAAADQSAHPYTNGFAIPSAINEDKKKNDDGRTGRPRNNSNPTWLPPGTKQEETWQPRDISASRGVVLLP